MEDEIREFSQTHHKRKQSYRLLRASLDTLESCLVQMNDQIKNTHNKRELQSIWKETSTNLSNDWKESYASVAKLSKTLDKRFKFDTMQDIVSPNRSADDNFIDSPTSLYTTIIQHFYRQGRFELADTFTKESNCSHDDHAYMAFQQLHQIVSQMQHKQDLSLAQAWVANHRDFLIKRDSPLEFQLSRLQYLHYCSLGKAADAINFFKSHAHIFGEKYLKEIKQLTGCLSYIHRLSSSPYGNLIYPALPWQEALDEFIQEYTAWLGLPYESPLACCVQIGMLALPKILKVSQLVKDKGIEWTSQNELPIEIDIPDTVRFHSVFTCPVSKELSTTNNPPMMLPCGHVICKEALSKLAKSSTSKIKCPYCPGESTATLAQRVYI